MASSELQLSKERPRRRAPLFVVLGIGLAALTGCSNVNAAPSTEHTISASPTTEAPKPSASPEAQSPEAFDAKIQAERQIYLNMTMEEFRALPEAEHSRFAALTNAVALERYMDIWNKNYPETAGLMPKASPDNTPEEIAAIDVWQGRLALAFTGNERLMYIESILRDGQDSPSYPGFMALSNAYPDALAPAIATQDGVLNMAVVENSRVIGTDDPNSHPIEITARIPLPNKEPYTLTYMDEDVPLINDTTYLIWRHE